MPADDAAQHHPTRALVQAMDFAMPDEQGLLAGLFPKALLLRAIDCGQSNGWFTNAGDTRWARLLAAQDRPAGADE